MRPFVFALLAGCPSAVFAQSDATQLYGRVTTVGGDTYSGPLRWDGEEVSWFDVFNSTKPENPYYKYAKRLPPVGTAPTPPSDDRDWSWHDERNRAHAYMYHGHTQHIFAVPFGAIAKVTMDGPERAELLLRDGRRFYLSGGSNDLGAQVQVLDPEIGELSLDWQRIQTVEFADAPSRSESRFGAVLYGTVETYGGEFTGFIQWDHDERLVTDKLDGESDDGKVSVEFGKIQTLERDGIGTRVVLSSGRALQMRGTNDVNSENRGIIVYHPEHGIVDIPWREFKRLSFQNAEALDRPTYRTYAQIGNLQGSVTTVGGKTYEGRLVYDLDEDAGYELIHGKDKGLEYQVPIFLVRTVVPRGDYGAYVELRNGKRLLLEDTQDVTGRNNGMLIFPKDSSNDPIYVPWQEVATVAFN